MAIVIGAMRRTQLPQAGGIVNGTTTTTITTTTSTTTTTTTPPITCRSSGSCDGRCGDEAEDYEEDDCFCGGLCDARADCCCDREAFCDLTSLGWISVNRKVVAPPSLPGPVTSPSQCIAGGSCSGRCGGRSQSGSVCWCDQICAQRGDCCCDKEQQCPQA